MSQQSTSRERLIAEWRKAYFMARAAAGQPGSQAAWMARARLRLYWFLLSLYGKGEWNSPTSLGGSSSTGTLAEGQILTGKPAKSIGTIRAALQSVSGVCDATPQAGPLAAGGGLDAWVVVASSGSGIDAFKCGAYLNEHGMIPRIVPGESETTVAVRSIHEPLARRLVAENHARFELPVTAPHPGPQSKMNLRAARWLIDYIAWVMLMAPAGALILWQNLVTFWPDIPAPPYELNIAVALFLCATLLFVVFMRSLTWLDGQKR